MADKDEKRVNPDPPRSPGTPEVPDLDVDPRRFAGSEPAEQQPRVPEPPD